MRSLFTAVCLALAIWATSWVSVGGCKRFASRAAAPVNVGLFSEERWVKTRAFLRFTE